MARSEKRGERIHAVVLTEQVPLQRAHDYAFVTNDKTLAGALCLPALVHAEVFHRCPAAALQHALEVRVAAVGDDEPVRRERAHQMVKLGFYRGEIWKDVRMVELQVVEERGARAVMHELGALVKKRGVVFVGFNNKEFRIGQSRRNAEIFRHSAD